MPQSVVDQILTEVDGSQVTNLHLMWEQMWRASIHYGRKGLGVHAISAVDLALWDLLGKTLGQPVSDALLVEH